MPVMTDRRTSKLTLSAVLLVIANLVPLYGVLVLDWSVRSVVLLFWLENLVVGGFNLLRIASASSDELPASAKITTGLFFAVHFGLFCFVHGVVLLALFPDPATTGAPAPAGDTLLPIVIDSIAAEGLLWPLLGIAVSHGVSFIANYLLGGEYRHTSQQQLMKRPYRRVIALQFTLVLGGLLVQALGSPTAALILLLALKTLMDLAAHLQEHRNTAIASDRVADRDGLH
jgi:hypothetical protein